MAAPADNYTVASGQPIYGGRAAPSAVGSFDSVTYTDYSYPPDASDNGKILLVELHGSGGQNTTTGRQYSAAVSGPMAYDVHNVFSFSTAKSLVAGTVLLRPNDIYGKYPNNVNRESMWLGFSNLGSDPGVTLITQRRLEALMAWMKTNLGAYNQTKTCLYGRSMGGWGTLTFGLRHPELFAALYPELPRWRYNDTGSEFAVADYPTGMRSYPAASAPKLSAVDGGGSYTALLDVITYIADTTKKIPWIGWTIHTGDEFSKFADHIAAVAALRTAKRAFAFAWAPGNHAASSIQSQITASYPYGTFEIGKGYPLFTQHSLDNDPSVDATGGINIGLSFRNVVESASGWSCEVTNLNAACTVKVEPISDVYQGIRTAKLVTIPAAGSWQTVQFP